MKKLFLLSVLLLLNTLSFGQGYDSGIGMSMNYGTKASSIAIEVSYSKDKQIAFGGGASFSFNSLEQRGTEIDTPFSWFNKVKVETGPTFSFYGLCGYEYNKFKIVGKLGVGYYNTVDTYLSTATNTYWYRIADTNSEVLLGSTLSYKIDKSWFLDLGYDNFNGVTFGGTYIF